MIRYHARWVLPVARPPIEHGTVVEDGGRIVFVGARDDAPAGTDSELGDAILLPGLVNAHTHLELTAMRGLLEDLDFADWISRLRAIREEVLTAEMMLDSARLGIVEGLETGITTYADTCSSAVVLDAMCEAGVRGVMYQEVFGPDPSRCDAMIEGLRNQLAMLRERQTALVSVGISPHAPFTVSDRLYVEAIRLAATEELPLALHVAESDAESQMVVAACGPFADALRTRGVAVEPRGRSPIALLETVGALGPRTLLIHCVRVDERDIGAIASSGAAVVHCPISNAKLGHGIAPVVELLEAGIHVGLGSDSVASNNRLDLLEEARAAALFQRLRTGRGDALPARAALELATIGGARALGLDSRIGSLEEGKHADLAAFSLDGVVPVGDPESAAVFSLSRRQAIFVAVAGRPLVRDGRVLAENDGLRERVAAIGDALGRWQLSPANS